MRRHNIVHWHSPAVKQSLAGGLAAGEIKRRLGERGVFDFKQYPSGLFAAAGQIDRKTGYGDAWLRDSACVAAALMNAGHLEPAQKAARGILAALAESFATPRSRKRRPAVRFRGRSGKPADDWPNAQNDALGYALWFIGTMATNGYHALSETETKTLSRTVKYLAAIKYWEDADNGHWEELAEVHASSIGAVVAGLQAIRPYVRRLPVTQLIRSGQTALDNLLPHESAAKPTDAALVFLTEPLGILSDHQAAQTMELLEHDLMGEYGVRRYLGDSYWAHNYRQHFSLGDRTADFTKRMPERDAFWHPGLEAQWTLFDPMLAAHYAKLKDKKTAEYYLSRSLGQFVEVDGKWKLPEAYFYEDGQWVINDHVGLAWSHANLLHALTVCERTFGESLLRIK